MWTREELKSNAKMILKRTYWMSFAACLIAGVLAGGSGVGNFVSNWNLKTQGDDLGHISQYYISPDILPIVFVIAGIVLIFSTLFTYFVSWPVIIGRNRFFMASRENDENLRELFFGFTGGSYFHVIKTVFFVDLYTFLWSMLFFVPGLIKHYEYFFVPYLLSENPKMDTDRAFELSREMSSGKKWEMFVLDLSFIGWNILGILCCGVGLFFVTPYYQAVMAELYAASRADVLQRGMTDDRELPGYVKIMM